MLFAANRLLVHASACRREQLKIGFAVNRYQIALQLPGDRLSGHTRTLFDECGYELGALGSVGRDREMTRPFDDAHAGGR